MDVRLAAYLPQDRRQALARGEELPERASGAALFADISGFTPLTEGLDRALGHRRGAEELTRQLNQVYTALIAEIERYGGSIIDFAGDSIMCWFEDGSRESGDGSWGIAVASESPTPNSHLPSPRQAVACALAIQQAMARFATIVLPDRTTTALALKVAVASGSARRFAVGDPAVRLFDIVAGTPLTQAAAGEHLAHPGEVLLDEATAAALGDTIGISEWRTDAESGARFAVIGDIGFSILDFRLPEQSEIQNPKSEIVNLRPWLLPAIYERHQAGLGDFLTELRPAVALFLRFSGIDFANDLAANAKLDALIRAIQEHSARYDGTLLQITIGDKGSYLYLVFGAPTAHEDDPRRAVACALELREVLATRAELEALQIGISRGVMRVGAYGGPTRQTYGVLGDDVNLAARLMSLAAPGEVLISGRVQAALGGTFALEPRAPIRLKGKAEPLPVFAVVGHSQRRAIRLEEPIYTLPMVGRADELSVIAEKLDLALSGQGQIVGIVAEAGMGKSRLVAEAIRLARRKGMQGYGGACQSSGTNTSYLVWGPIWRALLDLDPVMPLRRQVRTLEGLIGDWAADRVEALPLLGALLGISLPENDFTRTLEAQFRKSALELLLLDCLRAAAREAQAEGSGLLLVLEDLHWIDPLSHDLLEQAARAIVDLPILIVLAYRPPELLRLQVPRVEALDHFTRIVLPDLRAADAEQLIRAKLSQLFPERSGAVQRALIERITAKAQGNPFYVEELLNYLHDRGLDPQHAAALAALELPSSLHTLILSRIDQLSARQQATLKVASVIGRRFLHAHLHGAYPLLGAPEPLKDDLQELARLELTPLDTPEPELAYLFKHVVTQEVAYESLTMQARASLHEQLATYLERLAGDDTARYLDLLAFHYERSENLTKKREYLRRAGEAAAARYANDAAVDYLTRALDLAPKDDLAERFALLLAREQVYNLQGAREAQAQDIGALEELAEHLDDDQRRARVALYRAHYAHTTGAYLEAAAAAAQAVAWATAAGDGGVAAESEAFWGMTLTFAGQYSAAQPRLTRALELARAAGRADVEMRALMWLGAIAADHGDYSTAHALIVQDLVHARSRGDRQGECHALIAVGDITKKIGLYHDAHAALEPSLTLARTIGDRTMETYALQNLATLAATEGAYERALDYASQTQALAQTIGHRLLQAVAHMLIGHGLAGVARWDAAADAYRQSCDLYHALGRSDLAAEPLAGLARMALAQGHTAQALIHVERILVQIETRHLEGAEEPLRVDLTCCQVLRAANDPRAHAVLERAHARLLEQAAKIDDEAMRRSFLHNVPYHREIAAAWAAAHSAG